MKKESNKLTPKEALIVYRSHARFQITSGTQAKGGGKLVMTILEKDLLSILSRIVCNKCKKKENFII